MYMQNVKKITAFYKNNLGTLHGFVQLCVVRGLQIVLGLVTTYYLAHGLSISEYGEYQFALNVLGLLSIFSLTEFSNTLMQSVARGYYGSIRKILPYTFSASLLGSVALIFFALWYGIVEVNTPLMICFIAAALCFPFMYALTIWRGYKIGEEKFFSYTKVESAGMILTQLSTIMMILVFKGQYIGPFVCFIIVPSLINIWMITRILKRVHQDSPVEEGIIKYGVHSSIFVSASVASTYIDKLLIFFFLSPASLALFAAGDRVAELLRAAVQDVATALAPRFAKTSHYSQKLDRFLKIFSVLFGLGLLIFAFTVLPYVITIIYGQQYAPAIPYAQALMFSVAIGNLASLQFRYIRSKLDTKNFRNIMIITSICRIIISLFLIPLFGIMGAVTSSILYRIMLAVATDYVIRKDYRQLPAEQ